MSIPSSMACTIWSSAFAFGVACMSTGCVHSEHMWSGRSVIGAANELTRRGNAQIDSDEDEPHVEHRLAIDDDVTVFLEDQHQYEAIRVRDLIAGCATPTPAQELALRVIPPEERIQCAIDPDRRYSQHFVDIGATLRRVGVRSLQTLGMLAGSVVLIAPGYCTFECNEPWNDLARVAFVVEGVALGALVGLGIYELTHQRRTRR